MWLVTPPHVSGLCLCRDGFITHLTAGYPSDAAVYRSASRHRVEASSSPITIFYIAVLTVESAVRKEGGMPCRG